MEKWSAKRNRLLKMVNTGAIKFELHIQLTKFLINVHSMEVMTSKSVTHQQENIWISLIWKNIRALSTRVFSLED